MKVWKCGFRYAGKIVDDRVIWKCVIVILSIIDIGVNVRFR